MKNKNIFTKKGLRDLAKVIFSNKWYLICLLLPYIKPATELTGVFDNIFDVWKIVSSVIIVSLYFIVNNKPSKIILGLFLFQLIFVVSTLFSGGELWWASVQMLSIISLCMLFEMAILEDKRNAFISFGMALLFMTTLTAISMFVFYPNGMYVVKSATLAEHNNFLWGFDNSSIFKIAPSLTIAGILFYKFVNKKYYAIPFFVFASAAYIYVGSMTAGIVCVLLTILYITLIFTKKPLKFMDIKYVLPIVFIVFFLILIFNQKIDLIQTLAKKVNKGYSINSRFKMWETALNYFWKRPIIGYGFEFREVIKAKFLYDHVHNIFLDILYRGGFVAFSIYVYNYILVIKNNKMMSKVYNIASLGMLCIVICGIMDYYNDQYLMFLMIILGYYALYIESKYNSYRYYLKHVKKLNLEE